MRACISKGQARTAPNLAVPLFTSILFLAALLLAAPHAWGEARTSGKASASHDTTAGVKTDDEGFTVRVVEEGKTIPPAELARRGRAAAQRATDQGARDAARAQSANPSVPEPPEPPEPPDVGDSNDLVRFGEDVEIPADKVIDGDVVAVGGSVTVYGRVKGDCVAIGGTVRVKGSGVVEGDAVSLGGGVTTADSASVKGSNVSVGAWPFKGEGRGAMIPLLGIFGLSAFAGLVCRVVQFLLTIFFAWIALLLFRERMTHAADRLGEQFGKSFLYGLLGWAGLLVTVPAGIILTVLVGALAIVILAVTIIGIPVAILLAVALVLAVVGLVIGAMVAVFIAYLEGAMFLGRRILGRTRRATASPLRTVAYGLLLMVGLAIIGKMMGFVGLVFLMPIGIAFGIAAGMLAVVMTTAGFGAMMLTRFGKAPLGWPAGAAASAPSPSAASPSTAPPEGGTSDAP